MEALRPHKRLDMKETTLGRHNKASCRLHRVVAIIIPIEVRFLGKMSQVRRRCHWTSERVGYASEGRSRPSPTHQTLLMSTMREKIPPSL